jgi:hypothetical protein
VTTIIVDDSRAWGMVSSNSPRMGYDQGYQLHPCPQASHYPRVGKLHDGRGLRVAWPPNTPQEIKLVRLRRRP